MYLKDIRNPWLRRPFAVLMPFSLIVLTLPCAIGVGLWKAAEFVVESVPGIPRSAIDIWNGTGWWKLDWPSARALAITGAVVALAIYALIPLLVTL